MWREKLEKRPKRTQPRLKLLFGMIEENGDGLRKGTTFECTVVEKVWTPLSLELGSWEWLLSWMMAPHVPTGATGSWHGLWRQKSVLSSDSGRGRAEARACWVIEPEKAHAELRQLKNHQAARRT